MLLIDKIHFGTSYAGLSPAFIKIQFGPSITAFGHLGRGPEAAKVVPAKLIVPWQDLQENPDSFALLNWRARLSEFAGRDEQMQELAAWCQSQPAVSIKFVIGEGGTGKTRLAAQFATYLQGEKWEAGFVDLRHPQNFPMPKAGTLLIVDYPEENREDVCELLQDLAGLGNYQRLRVLFLSRRKYDFWAGVLHDCKASVLADPQPLPLAQLDSPAAHRLFCTAQEQAATVLKTTPTPVAEEVLSEWLKQAPENERALFILAAAVHSALNPEDEVVQYSGRQVMAALVERELTRLRRVAQHASAYDDYAVARLLAMTVLAGALPENKIREIVAREELEIGFRDVKEVGKILREAGLIHEHAFPAPKPDLIAAAFAVRVFSEQPRTAPELLWAALETDLGANLNRLGRVCYDAEVTLQMLEHRLSHWLAQAVENKQERCQRLAPFFSEATLPRGWIEAAVAVWRTLLAVCEDKEERAWLLNNLSTHIRDTGDSLGALTAIQESSKIYRYLAQEDQARFLPDLASSLNNLSGCLSDVGDTREALAAIREAVEIRRRLAQAEPARFLPDLASSLNNLSNRLSDTGDTKGALGAIQEAVEIRRRLAQAEPARFLPDLASSLNNLSGCLSDVGDTREALAAIREAVEIRRRLAQAEPARFLPDLAMSLNNLSNGLSDTGDSKGALATILEAVEIHRILVQREPARYGPDLAMSLNNLSTCLSDTGDLRGALAAIQEAVEIRRRLAQTEPARFLPDLAMSLGTMGTVWLRSGDKVKAESAFREGTEIIRPFAQQLPGSPFEKLSRTLEEGLRRAQEK